LITSDTPWVVVGPKRNVSGAFREVWDSRGVLLALVKREVSSRYRGSIFGFAWAILKPLMQLALFSLVIGNFLGASRSIENYTIFIFVSLMVWGFLSECITSGATSITISAGLVTKVSFPREILPISRVLIAGFNFLIQIPVLVIGYLIFGNWPTLSALVTLAPIAFAGVLFALSFALILSAINVYARDTQHLVEVLMMVLLYLSPIMYSWTFVWNAVQERFGSDLFFKIYMLNPISAIVVAFQDALWGGERFYADGSPAGNLIETSTITYWGLPVLGIVFLYFSYRLFLRLEPNFAREL
jgi:ABC-2 type transport system permease protein